MPPQGIHLCLDKNAIIYNRGWEWLYRMLLGVGVLKHTFLLNTLMINVTKNTTK